jgi:TRAP-type C4-dicarboxylate transport system permease small subunit
LRKVLETFLHIFGVVDRVFKQVVESLLASVLLGMVALVFLQVILRDFFHSGISWADVAGRHMVLWIAFLGAMLTTRSRQHLSIDLVSRLVPKRVRNVIRFFLDMVACVVCIFLMRAAITLVVEEHAMGTEIFSGVPLWIIQLIIPIGFLVMALEYALGVVLDVLRLLYNGVAAKLASERRPL